MDGDNDMDLICVQYGDLVWYKNIDGQGTFGNEIELSNNLISDFVRIKTADLDGDNDLDIFVPGTNGVTMFENTNGLGNFNEIPSFSNNVEGIEAIIDLDNDGDMDILSWSSSDDEIKWYENQDGLGDFTSEKMISTVADRVASVVAVDMDLDGDLDLVALSSLDFDNQLSWYEHIDGVGTFGSPQYIMSTLYQPSRLFVSDMDGDGDKDIIASANGLDEDRSINWYENVGVVSNEIIGMVTYDINSNGCDSSDLVVSNVMVETDNSNNTLSTFTVPSGLFQFFPDEGTFTTTINPPVHFVETPSSHASSFVGIGNIDTANFCLIAPQAINDLNITLLPTSEARPGFDASYQIVYHNVGTTQLNGNIMLEFEGGKLNFLTASDTIATQNANTITFDYTDLNPFESRTIDLQFNILPPPIVNIDDNFHFTATINPITGDFTEDDNVFDLIQLAIGAYDPNDIQVLEGDEIHLNDADKYLHYIIRFQNTGTASAIKVRVENVLDDYLDWQTMQLVSSSHTNPVSYTHLTLPTICIV